MLIRYVTAKAVEKDYAKQQRELTDFQSAADAVMVCLPLYNSIRYPAARTIQILFYFAETSFRIVLFIHYPADRDEGTKLQRIKRGLT